MIGSTKFSLQADTGLRFASALLCGTAMAAFPQVAFAQDADQDVSAQDDENAIVVSGTRETIQNSIESKRNSVEVFDALSSDEIGNLPALSIGEALETLTGAASHREQGGATEIAVRGLGPFLSSTVINGRAASNGSGDRSVNFSQFPSELFNKIGIYKTQSASQIEGGVAGQIVLDTLKPLEYGKQRFQTEVKGNYNPDNNDITPEIRERNFGYRVNASYVDQFRLGEGELGISLGYSHNTTTNPEQEANASPTLVYCKNDPTDRTVGVFDDNNCDTPIPAEGSAAFGQPFIIAGNSYTYRQNVTDDNRNAVFGAIQYQPSSAVDINLDFQYSKRKYDEQRNDLIFAEGRRIDGATDVNRLPYDLIIGDNGELLQFTSEQRIETLSAISARDETYYGGGLSFDWQASDQLKLSFDGSYSETQRFERGAEVRLQSEARDIFGVAQNYGARESDGDFGTSVNSTQRDRIETATLIRQNGSDTFNFIVQNFDVTNPALFSTAGRARVDIDQDRFNSIFALRGDAEYTMDGFLSSIQLGARYQELKYRDVPGSVSGTSRFERTYTDAAVKAANLACRRDFPETGFLSSVANGNPLITNVNAAGTVIGTANGYATFDAKCMLRVLEGTDRAGVITFDDNGDPIYPDGNFDSIDNNDVNEKSWAGYIQANFDQELGATPIRGNVGLRVIKTDVTSNGFRAPLQSSTNVDGTINITAVPNSLVSVTGNNSYTEFLPSLNLVADIQPDLLVRFAVFRALSRPDPNNLGFGRTFNALTDDSADATTIADAVGSATASGNPFTDPLLSWNFDTAVEWYPNKDTILAVGAYYKSFNGGFQNIGQFEDFEVDGQTLRTVVRTVNTSEETSKIYGFEVTAAHRFSYLPAPLDGLGFKISYNYANSDFEFEDGVLGATRTVNDDLSITTNPGVVPPGDIFGLSKHVLSAQVYYQIGKLDLQGVYKYRSNYFQQFVDSPDRLRYVDDTGTYEARISYQLNKQVRLTLEGINLFNEPRVDYRGTLNNLSSTSVYGPRYFAGIRFKF